MQHIWQRFEGVPSLIISPHYDDAVLSCWHLLSLKTATVLTVCSGAPETAVSTDWDILCGFTSSDEALSSRELENAEALSGWALNHQKAGLVDFGYREGRRFSDVETKKLQSQVAAWLKTQNTTATIVAIPVGAGRSRLSNSTSLPEKMVRPNEHKESKTGLRDFLKGLKHKVFLLFSKRMLQHPDHVDVRDSLLHFLLNEELVTTLFYEELPYLWHSRGQAEINRLLAKNPDLSCTKLTAKVEISHKFNSISKYKSQLAGLDPGLNRLKKKPLIPWFETYWVVSKSN